MAEKLAIERYKLSHGKQHCDIFFDDLDIATVYEKEYVHLLAASPLMLKALREAYDYIIEVARQFGIVPEADVTERIVAAIAAAEGE